MIASEMTAAAPAAARDGGAPLDVRQLLYGEQLVLWAARHWLADAGVWPRVREEFALACGCARAPRALDGLERLLRALNTGGGAPRDGRTVWLHRLSSPRVSGDELALLRALASYQAGEPHAGRILLEWLLPASAVAADAGSAAAALAAALRESGHLLPRRRAVPASCVPGAGAAAAVPPDAVRH
jgi:hypothetical protein